MLFDAAHDGMTMGFTGTFEQLDAYLAKVTRQVRDIFRQMMHLRATNVYWRKS